jgi:DNA polymerase-1
MDLDFPVVDFETYGIAARPDYPPEPVGVSIALPGADPLYMSWGHPTGNNTTKAKARAVLTELWQRAPRILFHNGKFDVDVAETHMVPKRYSLLKDPLRVEDTLFLLFLDDPHARSLSLKPAYERLMKVKSSGRDELKEWIIANVPEAKRRPTEWGAYIAKAPAHLVAPYANGDTHRTRRIYELLYPRVTKAGMLEAYQREQRLMPILLRNEMEGIRVDMARLRKDIKVYSAALERADRWIRLRLRTPNLNIDSNDELADALERAGFKNFTVTPGGQRSVGKESLLNALEEDAKLLQAIGYHNRMTTCLSMFMKRWYDIGERTGGRIHTQWHQVRHGHGDASGINGARTGRIIATDPNLLNLAKSFEDRDDGYVHPKFLKVEPLPLVRVYLLPDEDYVWGHRDYNQQEFRITAHFEDGALLRAYKENPALDVHEHIRQVIHRVRHVLMERRPVKIVNFGMLYGMGIAGTARKLKVDASKAREIKGAQKAAIPDVHEMAHDLKELGERGEPIRTWGGRLYYAEEPKVIDGHTQRYEYKLLNYLIQGSAADATKEAVIRYDAHPQKKWGRFMVTVYDEINASLPSDPTALKREMRALRESMEGLAFDLPMLSDAKVGKSWGELKKYDDQSST